jgi:mannose-1-phosphate guanylyltransferase
MSVLSLGCEARATSVVRTAMILGAGRGTRLGPLGLTVPKILVEVGGLPLLRRQLDYLSFQGITRAVVNSHYLAEEVAAFVRSYDGPIDLIEIRERRLLGTAGGVRHALELLGDAPFLVVYGDVVMDESLRSMLRAHARNEALATLAVYESADVFGKGTVKVGQHGRVIGFAEKATTEPPYGSALVNAGVYVIDPTFVSDLPVERELDFGHDVFPAALRRGVPISSHRLNRPVIDVGTPEGLARARARVALAYESRVATP